MRIPARFFPAMILAVFALFVILGLVLGFRPQHGGSHRGGVFPQMYTIHQIREL